MDPAPELPWMPEGTTVELSRGRELFVRDSGGSGPPVVLLHGWMATADLNYGFEYSTLAADFRVIAFDQRGHGRGLRSRSRFGFSRCAGDIVAVLDTLGIERAIAVGYSMGGPIALRFAQRHPQRAAGLVLCATAGAFTRSPLRRRLFWSLAPLVDVTRLIPDSALRRSASHRFISRRAGGPYRQWIADEIAPSDLTTIAQAGVALGRFDGSRWIDRITTPTASVVTVDDRLVPPTSQRRLADAIRAGSRHEVTGGHTTCFDHPETFTPVLVDAIGSVAERVAPPVRF